MIVKRGENIRDRNMHRKLYLVRLTCLISLIKISIFKHKKNLIYGSSINTVPSENLCVCVTFRKVESKKKGKKALTIDHFVTLLPMYAINYPNLEIF